MKILITGGAGYIGSHAVRRLLDRGHQIRVMDSLEKGFRMAVDPRAEFEKADIGEVLPIQLTFKDGSSPDAVLHFAAYIEVGESVQKPERYLENNFRKAMKFFNVVASVGIPKIVLSSTAAVYGDPQQIPIPENHPKSPINPYGDSKSQLEDGLKRLAFEKKLGAIALRYFNVAGAWPDGSIGEAHDPESHLIPNILKAAKIGSPLKVFGNDYDTRDGTCVRDYVHVVDLVDAHEQALAHCRAELFDAFNLGSQNGFSVLEVIQTCESVLGKRIAYDILPRRPGDPASLVAESRRARELLGWKPEFPKMESMIEHASRWHQSHPRGYLN